MLRPCAKVAAGLFLLALSACAQKQEELALTGVEPGFQMLANEDYAAAEEYFLRLLAEEPRNPYGHLNLGAARQSLGLLDLARESYQTAVALGEDVHIDKTAFGGEVDYEPTTVAELAEYNLSNLP